MQSAEERSRKDIRIWQTMEFWFRSGQQIRIINWPFSS